jgi:DNA-binding MarR family transcriptional regulator
MDGVRWLDDEEQRAWRSLVVVSSRLFDLLDAELRAAHDLSLADYEILANLSEAPSRRLRMSQLAEVAMVSRSRLTHHVNRMEAEGLVTREACPTDRRGAFAVLTPDGMSRVEAAAPTHVAGVRRLFVDLLPGPGLPAVAEALGGVARALLPDRGAVV